LCIRDSPWRSGGKRIKEPKAFGGECFSDGELGPGQRQAHVRGG
jgi:hypothetical protein